MRGRAAAAALAALAAMAAGCAAGAAPRAEAPAPSGPAQVRSAPVALVPDGPGDRVLVEAPPGGRARAWLRVANGGDAARRLALRAGPWLRAPAAVDVPPRQSVRVGVEAVVPSAAPVGDHATHVAVRADGDPGAALPVSYESAVRVTVRVLPGAGG